MEVRFIQSDEADVCNGFYNRIYGKRRTVDQWRWEFASAPPFAAKSAPAANQGDGKKSETRLPFVVVDDNGKLAGTQAFIRIPMIDNTGVFWTVKSEETLVDPAYRGQGLFEKMYTPLLGYMKDEGIHCIWGFTAATKAFTRLGFQTPTAVSQLFFPFTADAASEELARQQPATAKKWVNRLKDVGTRVACGAATVVSSLRFKATRTTHRGAGIEIRPLEEPPAEAGELMHRFVKQWGGQTIYRDTDYLRWRLFSNPYQRSLVRGAYREGKLVGWVAYTMSEERMGYLVDLIATTDDEKSAKAVTTELLADAIRTLRRMGARGVRGWRVTKHPFDSIVGEAARSLGFFHVHRGNMPVLYVNERSERRNALGQFDNWYVTRVFTEGVLG